MEITAPNTIKVPTDEQLFELIKLIKPEHEKGCRFLEGPLWPIGRRTINEKLVDRTYHVINHHLYRVEKKENARIKSTYLKVSGRGNVNEVTKEEALEVVGLRKGYVDDYDLGDLGPETDPSVPYTTVNCDW